MFFKGFGREVLKLQQCNGLLFVYLVSSRQTMKSDRIKQLLCLLFKDLLLCCQLITFSKDWLTVPSYYPFYDNNIPLSCTHWSRRQSISQLRGFPPSALKITLNSASRAACGAFSEQISELSLFFNPARAPFCRSLQTEGDLAALLLHRRVEKWRTGAVGSSSAELVVL